MTYDTDDYARVLRWTVDFAGWGSSPNQPIHDQWVVSVLMDHLNEDRLGSLFPRALDSERIAALPVGVRMHNILHREGLDTFGAISHMSVDDLLRLRGAGVGSVQQLLSALVDRTVWLDLNPAPEEVIVEEPLDEVPAWQAQALDDIAVLARWHRLLGADDAPVFGAPEGLSEPRDVRTARARLSHLSAAIVLPPRPVGGEAAATITRALEGLDERSLALVRDRLVADSPATLDTLGARFEVTRERIRQVETQTRALLRARLEVGELAALAGAVRDAISPFLTLRALLQRYPSLGENVESLGQPVWRVLDRIDDAYEIKDDWCSTGTVSDAVGRTRELLRERAGGRGFVEMGAIEDEVELSEAWLAYVGVTVLRGCVLVETPSIPDRAEVILFTQGEPMPAAEIQAALGVDRALNAVKNALAVDRRFRRVDRDSWALAAWGLQGYQPIRVMIGRTIDAAGGEIALDELVDELSSKFDISSNSVVTYAAAHPYITARGRVRRRGRRDLRRMVRRKGLAQTRSLYRYAGGVKLRVVINSEHLRGSGTPLPNALGEAIDLPLSESRKLPTADGRTVSVSWGGPQIALGSVRTELELLQIRDGDVVFWVFDDDGSFAVEPLARASSAGDRLAALTGGPFDDGSELFESIADRIDAQGSGREAVVAALAARGDAQLVELVDQLDGDGAASLPVVELRSIAADAAGAPAGGATLGALEQIFAYMLENLDVWTAQTYRAGAEFAPYLQSLREYNGGYACELSSNAFLSPPLGVEQLESLRFLGWLDPDLTDGLPNHHQSFGPEVEVSRIATILARTLIDAVHLTEHDDVEFGPRSPELDAFVAARLARGR